MSINSEPCESITEIIKRPSSGVRKNAGVMDMTFIFSPISTLETVTHAATGMDNIFCQYVYQDENQVYNDIPHFESFFIMDLFDDFFPKHVAVGWRNHSARAKL